MEVEGILRVPTVHSSAISNHQAICWVLPIPSLEICPDPTGPATFRKDRSAVEDLSSVSFFGRKCPGVSAKELLWASVVFPHWKASDCIHKTPRIHLQIMQTLSPE